ncbi:MAG: hypothetical protein ABFD77_01205, partial [Thermotogota bacterium]
MTRKANDNYPTDIGLARWIVRHAAGLAILPKLPDRVLMLEPCCGDTAPFATAGGELGFIPYGYDVRDVRPQLWDEGGLGCGQFDVYDVNYERLHSFKHDDDYDGGPFNIIATNPPFTLGEAVVRKSLRMLAPNGCAAFLTKVAFLSTFERSKLFVQRPPAEVWLLRSRPSFTGDGKTDIAQEYAVSFWYGAELAGAMKT